MEFSVRINPALTKRLVALRRGGGNALQASEHAHSIINQVLNGVFSPRHIGRLTRYGDARIPNCIKFDLVRGYRLIAVLGKREICFLFVGSHDECDHWIRNNAGFELPAEDKIPVSSQVMSGKDEGEISSGAQEQEAGMEIDDYDAMLLRDLTDRDLRRIFSGLCRKRS
jgi:hypothetical protein